MLKTNLLTANLHPYLEAESRCIASSSFLELQRFIAVKSMSLWLNSLLSGWFDIKFI